jgi:hypothetical protein
MTARPATALTYGSDLVRVTVPAGTRAMRADPDVWWTAGNNTPLDQVQEYTLAPGSRFRVTGTGTIREGGRTVRTIEITVLPGEAAP